VDLIGSIIVLHARAACSTEAAGREALILRFPRGLCLQATALGSSVKSREAEGWVQSLKFASSAAKDGRDDHLERHECDERDERDENVLKILNILIILMPSMTLMLAATTSRLTLFPCWL
jgi:hypothetical protein